MQNTNQLLILGRKKCLALFQSNLLQSMILGYWDEKSQLYKLNFEYKESVQNICLILKKLVNRMSTPTLSSIETLDQKSYTIIDQNNKSNRTKSDTTIKVM